MVHKLITILLLLFCSLFVYSQDTLMVVKGEYIFNDKQGIVKEDSLFEGTFVREYFNIGNNETYTQLRCVSKNNIIHFIGSYNEKKPYDQDDLSTVYLLDPMTALVININFIEVQYYFADSGVLELQKSIRYIKQ